MADLFRLPLEPAKSTLCWHCCHDIGPRPIGLPMHRTDRGWVTRGAFCSMPCAQAFRLAEGFDCTHNTDVSLLGQMAAELGMDPSNCHPAPSRFALQAFGGPLTIEQFRSASAQQVMVAEHEFNALPLELVVSGCSESTSLRGLRKPAQQRPSGQVLVNQDVPSEPLYKRFCDEAKNKGSIDSFIIS